MALPHLHIRTVNKLENQRLYSTVNEKASNKDRNPTSRRLSFWPQQKVEMCWSQLKTKLNCKGTAPAIQYSLDLAKSDLRPTLPAVKHCRCHARVWRP